MYFSRSILASALLGMAAATMHETTAIAISASFAASGAHTATSAATAAASAVHSAAPSAGENLAAGSVPIHVVQVGGPNGSLIFSPENIVAQPGDLVQFHFNPKNHSVVQSTFDQPCVPIQNIMPNKTDAFFSGFMPSNATAVAAGSKLTYTIRVMDTKPIWYYCSQGMHCQGGMVGAINAPPSGNRTMSAFKQLAGAATENLSPGQAPGQGNAGGQPSSAPLPSESAAGGEGGATQTADGGATGSVPGSPAQQTTSGTDRVSQSIFGLVLSALAAFMLL